MANVTHAQKIASLMAKATDPVATPAEAETAMLMARKLMAKFDITEEDIKKLGAAAFVEDTYMCRKTKSGAVILHPIDRYCGTLIADFCGCKVWRSMSDDGVPRVKYMGVDADAEFARYLRAAWIKHFDFNWEMFVQGHRRLADMAAARVAFSQSFASAMRDRLDGWQQKAPVGQTALVVKRADLVTAEMAKRGLHLSKSTVKGKSANHGAGAGAGYQAGRSASVGAGVAAGAGNVRLLT